MKGKKNVKLALQIFKKFTAEALSSLRKKLKIPQFGNTNVFIKIILTWWQIVNVKKTWKGKKLRYSFEEPLTAAENSESKQFLQYFLNRVETWKASLRGGTLTKETFTALCHTTHALVEISDFCIQELGAKYVLL